MPTYLNPRETGVSSPFRYNCAECRKGILVLFSTIEEQCLKRQSPVFPPGVHDTGALQCSRRKSHKPSTLRLNKPCEIQSELKIFVALCNYILWFVSSMFGCLYSSNHFVLVDERYISLSFTSLLIPTGDGPEESVGK